MAKPVYDTPPPSGPHEESPTLCGPFLCADGAWGMRPGAGIAVSACV